MKCSVMLKAKTSGDERKGSRPLFDWPKNEMDGSPNKNRKKSIGTMQTKGQEKGEVNEVRPSEKKILNLTKSWSTVRDGYNGNNS